MHHSSFSTLHYEVYCVVNHLLLCLNFIVRCFYPDYHMRIQFVPVIYSNRPVHNERRSATSPSASPSQLPQGSVRQTPAAAAENEPRDRQRQHVTVTSADDVTERQVRVISGQQAASGGVVGGRGGQRAATRAAAPPDETAADTAASRTVRTVVTDDEYDQDLNRATTTSTRRNYSPAHTSAPPQSPQVGSPVTLTSFDTFYTIEITE